MLMVFIFFILFLSFIVLHAYGCIRCVINKIIDLIKIVDYRYTSAAPCTRDTELCVGLSYIEVGV